MNSSRYDEICDWASGRTYHGMPLLLRYDDPFLNWIVSLGIREAAWLKANGK